MKLHDHQNRAKRAPQIEPQARPLESPNYVSDVATEVWRGLGESEDRLAGLVGQWSQGTSARRVFLELVRDVGAPAAQALWSAYGHGLGLVRVHGHGLGLVHVHGYGHGHGHGHGHEDRRARAMVAAALQRSPRYAPMVGAIASRREIDGTGLRDESVRAALEEVDFSSGQPLDDALAQELGARFGHDLSSVRVHTDDGAEKLCARLHALAVTIGEHIFFASGRFAPQSDDGRRLLRHELTHVVQHFERRLPAGKAVSSDSDPTEQEARRQETPVGRLPAPTVAKDRSPSNFGAAVAQRKSGKTAIANPKAGPTQYLRLMYGEDEFAIGWVAVDEEHTDRVKILMHYRGHLSHECLSKKATHFQNGREIFDVHNFLSVPIDVETAGRLRPALANLGNGQIEIDLLGDRSQVYTLTNHYEGSDGRKHTFSLMSAGGIVDSNEWLIGQKEKAQGKSARLADSASVEGAIGSGAIEAPEDRFHSKSLPIKLGPFGDEFTLTLRAASDGKAGYLKLSLPGGEGDVVEVPATCRTLKALGSGVGSVLEGAFIVFSLSGQDKSELQLYDHILQARDLPLEQKREHRIRLSGLVNVEFRALIEPDQDGNQNATLHRLDKKDEVLAEGPGWLKRKARYVAYSSPVTALWAYQKGKQWENEEKRKQAAPRANTELEGNQLLEAQEKHLASLSKQREEALYGFSALVDGKFGAKTKQVWHDFLFFYTSARQLEKIHSSSADTHLLMERLKTEGPQYVAALGARMSELIVGPDASGIPKHIAAAKEALAGLNLRGFLDVVEEKIFPSLATRVAAEYGGPFHHDVSGARDKQGRKEAALSENAKALAERFTSLRRVPDHARQIPAVFLPDAEEGKSTHVGAISLSWFVWEKDGQWHLLDISGSNPATHSHPKSAHETVPPRQAFREAAGDFWNNPRYAKGHIRYTVPGDCGYDDKFEIYKGVILAELLQDVALAASIVGAAAATVATFGAAAIPSAAAVAGTIATVSGVVAGVTGTAGAVVDLADLIRHGDGSTEQIGMDLLMIVAGAFSAGSSVFGRVASQALGGAEGLAHAGMTASAVASKAGAIYTVLHAAEGASTLLFFTNDAYRGLTELHSAAKQGSDDEWKTALWSAFMFYTNHLHSRVLHVAGAKIDKHRPPPINVREVNGQLHVDVPQTTNSEHPDPAKAHGHDSAPRQGSRAAAAKPGEHAAAHASAENAGAHAVAEGMAHDAEAATHGASRVRRVPSLKEILRTPPEVMSVLVHQGKLTIYKQSGMRKPGQEPSLIVISAAGNSFGGRSMAQAEATHLGDGADVYLVDRRATSKKGNTPGDVPSDELVADLQRVLEEVRARHPGVPIKVDGFSLGGFEAIALASQPGFAARFPNVEIMTFGGAATMSPVPGAGVLGALAGGGSKVVGRRAVPNRTPHWLMKQQLRRFGTVNVQFERNVAPGALENFANPEHNVGVDLNLLHWMLPHTANQTSPLPTDAKIEVPIKFIAGGADKQVTPAAVEQLFHKVPGNKKVMYIIPGAGHVDLVTMKQDVPHDVVRIDASGKRTVVKMTLADVIRAPIGETSSAHGTAEHTGSARGTAEHAEWVEPQTQEGQKTAEQEHGRKPWLVRVGGEEVLVSSQEEADAARAIIEEAKTVYGINISSATVRQKLWQRFHEDPVRQKRFAVPDHVLDRVQVQAWHFKELVALQTALADYAALLGQQRSNSPLGETPQPIQNIGKLSAGLTAPRLDVLKNVNVHETMIAECRSEDQSLVFYSGQTHTTYGFGSNAEGLRAIATHELTHGLLQPARLKEFIREVGFWYDETQKWPIKGEPPPTEYGLKNAKEDLADTIAYYKVNPEWLKANRPMRYRWAERQAAAGLIAPDPGAEPHAVNQARRPISANPKPAGDFFDHRDVQFVGHRSDIGHAEVKQGTLGDCDVIAAINASIHANSAWVADTVRDIGDGTFEVTLWPSETQSVIYRVSLEVPVDNDGSPLYGRGRDATSYVVEKALALHVGGYGALQDPEMSTGQVMSLLNRGRKPVTLHMQSGRPNKRLAQIAEMLEQKRPVIVGSIPATQCDAAQLALAEKYGVAMPPQSESEVAAEQDSSRHAYAVIALNRKAKTISLHNPWGDQHIEEMPFADFMKLFDDAYSVWPDRSNGPTSPSSPTGPTGPTTPTGES